MGNDSIAQEIKNDSIWKNTNYVKVLFANFLLYFSFMLLMPLLPLYMTDTFGTDKHTIGVILSGYTLTCLIVRIFSGYIVDSYPRKVVLLLCNFIFFVLFAGYIVAGSLTLFAIFRILHGAPFGATTVAASTVAIDVLPSSKRPEGIGYYGLSNNLATAISPMVAIALLNWSNDYILLFWIAMVSSFLGVILEYTIQVPQKAIVSEKNVVSFDRFFLVKGWSQALTMVCFSFSYGVVSTYVAIYSKEEIGMTEGSGTFFLLLSLGLMLSRITGARALSKGFVAKNATEGVCVSIFGYLLFAAVHQEWAFYAAALIIGLGNGHMYPAFQTMFVNLAEHNRRGTANSSLLTSWDVGFGIGVLSGGCIVDAYGYGAAFWMAWIINAIGVALFFIYSKNHFLRNKLR